MNHPTPMDEHHLFARDGHLTLLTLERFEQGELSVRGCELVFGHLEACPQCAERWSTLEATGEALLPPPELVGTAAHPPRFFRAAALGIGFALAASALLVLWPQPQTASLRPSEAPLSASPYTTTSGNDTAPSAGHVAMRVYAGEDARPLDAQRALAPSGEALRVDVQADPGWYAALLVVEDRVDPRDDFGTGGMEDLGERFVLWSATAVDPETDRLSVVYDGGLSASDDTLERLVAVSCPEPFDVHGFDIDHPEVQGCVVDELVVARFGGYADS